MSIDQQDVDLFKSLLKVFQRDYLGGQVVFHFDQVRISGDQEICSRITTQA